jgi:hypothetical protein
MAAWFFNGTSARQERILAPTDPPGDLTVTAGAAAVISTVTVAVTVAVQRPSSRLSSG